MWQQNRRSLLVSLFYGILSISMTFFNKAVLSYYNFKFTFFLLLLQLLFTVLTLFFLKSRGSISIPALSEINNHKGLLGVSFAYTLNALFALSALGDLNVPMYNTLKRMSTLVTLVLEYFLLHKISSFKVTVSVLIIILGTVVAGAGDLSFDLMAYAMAMGSCLLQSTYLVLVAKTGRDLNLDSLAILYYNSLFSLPALFAVTLFDGQFMAVWRYPLLFDSNFLITLMLALLQGSLLNYSLFLCTNVNSAVTTTVVGQTKMILSTFLGFFVFGGKSKPTFLNLLGIGANTLGGMMYGYVKFEEQQAKAQQAKGHQAKV